MNKLTVAALVAVMGFAGTASAQRAQVQKQPVKTPSKVTAPKAATGKAVQSNTDALLSTAKSLTAGKKLTPAVSEGTCDTLNSLTSSTSSVLKGSEKTAFLKAISAINYNGAQIIQPCQANKPITDEAALRNLGKIVIEVGGKVQRNEAVASDINTWGAAISSVMNVSLEDGLIRAKGLAEQPSETNKDACGLLNL